MPCLEVMGAGRIWRTEIEGGRYRDGKRWHAENRKGLRYGEMRGLRWEVMKGTSEKRQRSEREGDRGLRGK